MRRGNVPEQPDDREGRHRRAEARQHVARSSEARHGLVAARGNRHRDAAQETGERYRAQLPVPVDARVDEKRDVRPRCDGRQRTLSSTHRCHERSQQRGEEYCEPDRPDLRERLQIEVVRVSHLQGVRTVSQVPGLVGAGPRPEQRVGAHGAPGMAPQDCAAATRGAEQPSVQVRPAAAWRACCELIPALASKRLRTAVPRNDE